MCHSSNTLGAGWLKRISSCLRESQQAVNSPWILLLRSAKEKLSLAAALTGLRMLQLYVLEVKADLENLSRCCTAQHEGIHYKYLIPVGRVCTCIVACLACHASVLSVKVSHYRLVAVFARAQHALVCSLELPTGYSYCIDVRLWHACALRPSAGVLTS